MDSFNFHKVKTGKANKIQKHRHLQMIGNFLRVSIQQLQVVLKHSSEYFHGFMVSPGFVFLFGNAIIITLFAQSGHFSAPNSSKTGSEPDFYLEFLQNSTMNQNLQANRKKLSIKAENSIKGQRNHGYIIKYQEKQGTKTEERIKLAEKQGTKTEERIKLEEKQGRKTEKRIKLSEKQGTKTEERIKLEEKQGTKTEERIKLAEKQDTKTEEITELEEKQGTKTKTSLELKDYRRCQSDIVRGVVESEKPQRVLQRCETDNNMRRIEGVASETESVRKTPYPEDGMSNDEFRCKIEAFIARQQRLRTKELQAFSS
ncbi:hypothetical protein SESBI_31598 [Sesbania bispinosa]|nr:hypothetical protein SESBI_31598 [Sesbania bispinosa]